MQVDRRDLPVIVFSVYRSITNLSLPHRRIYGDREIGVDYVA